MPGDRDTGRRHFNYSEAQMRFYGSIRLPIFKRFAPRIGFVTDSVHPFQRRYTSAMVDETTLLPHHPFPWGAWLIGLALAVFIAYLSL